MNYEMMQRVLYALAASSVVAVSEAQAKTNGHALLAREVAFDGEAVDAKADAVPAAPSSHAAQHLASANSKPVAPVKVQQ